MRYLICKNENGENKICCESKAKSDSYLKSAWKRLSKMFPEYSDFRIVSAEEWARIKAA